MSARFLLTAKGKTSENLFWSHVSEIWQMLATSKLFDYKRHKTITVLNKSCSVPLTVASAGWTQASLNTSQVRSSKAAAPSNHIPTSDNNSSSKAIMSVLKAVIIWLPMGEWVESPLKYNNFIFPLKDTINYRVLCTNSDTQTNLVCIMQKKSLLCMDVRMHTKTHAAQTRTIWGMCSRAV